MSDQLVSGVIFQHATERLCHIDDTTVHVGDTKAGQLAVSHGFTQSRFSTKRSFNVILALIESNQADQREYQENSQGTDHPEKYVLSDQAVCIARDLKVNTLRQRMQGDLIGDCFTLGVRRRAHDR